MTADSIPKGVRKFRIQTQPVSSLQPSAMTGVIPSRNTTFLQNILGAEVGCAGDNRRSLDHLKQGILVNLVSSGVRHDTPLKNILDESWSVWSLDVRPFEDPDHDPGLRSHVGRHIDVVKGLLKHIRLIEELMQNAGNWASGTSPRKQCVIEFYCKSGRHRSVGLITIIGYLLRMLSLEVNIVHQSAWSWSEMRCGGRCSKCKLEDSRANDEFVELMKPWVRKFSGTVHADFSLSSRLPKGGFS